MWRFTITAIIKQGETLFFSNIVCNLSSIKPAEMLMLLSKTFLLKTNQAQTLSFPVSQTCSRLQELMFFNDMITSLCFLSVIDYVPTLVKQPGCHSMKQESLYPKQTSVSLIKQCQTSPLQINCCICRVDKWILWGLTDSCSQSTEITGTQTLQFQLTVPGLIVHVWSDNLLGWGNHP